MLKTLPLVTKIWKLFPTSLLSMETNIYPCLLISAIFTEENFDNQCKLFIGYDLLIRKMKELLLNKFLSNANESTTFSMNTGPDFGGSC